MIADTFKKYGFDAAGGLLVYGRHLDMVVDLLFDRTNPEETKRAYDCFKECVEMCTREGYGLYRANTAFMSPMTTVAPRSAKATAVARPMPVAAPVIRTTLFSKFESAITFSSCRARSARP